MIIPTSKFDMIEEFGKSVLDMPVPKGTFYGEDQWGTWVCIHKELYPFDKPTLELYRWNNEQIGWVLTIEQSETVNYICRCANKYDLWKIPIEYGTPTPVIKPVDKYEGAEQIAFHLYQNPRARGKKSYKTVAQHYYQHRWFKNDF